MPSRTLLCKQQIFKPSNSSLFSAQSPFRILTYHFRILTYHFRRSCYPFRRSCYPFRRSCYPFRRSCYPFRRYQLLNRWIVESLNRLLNSELETQNSKLKTRNSKLKTQNSKLLNRFRSLSLITHHSSLSFYAHFVITCPISSGKSSLPTHLCLSRNNTLHPLQEKVPLQIRDITFC